MRFPRRRSPSSLPSDSLLSTSIKLPLAVFARHGPHPLAKMASAEFCPTLLSPSKPATAVVHPVQVDRDSATSRELPNLEARPERPIDLPQRPLAAALPWLVPSLESSTIIAFAHKYPVSHPARTDIRTGEFSFADTIAWVVEDVERDRKSVV